MTNPITRAFNLLHAYVYGRWTDKYLAFFRDRLIPRLKPRGRQRVADGFHCKVLTSEEAKAIITIDQPIVRRDLEQIIPYAAARTLILRAPPDIIVHDCPCRRTQENPCQPLQVCMIIGKPFADFMLQQHPESARRISREEALDVLQAEHERGHVHTAWFKDAMGGRFYALCNCCPCCCFGLTVMAKYAAPMVAASGHVAQVDDALCSACGACEEACPFGAIQVDGRAVVSWETCMGCGVCTGQCPSGAVSLARDERKGVPLDVRLLATDRRAGSTSVEGRTQ
jgi:ferredoxin